LTECFQKTRELYPDSLLLTDTIFVSGDDVITEWTLQATLTEPFYGDLSRKVRVSVQGASIVRTDNGKITDWEDYYDGLVSRRTALASYFTDWVELWTAVGTAEPRKHKHSLRRSRTKARNVIVPSDSEGRRDERSLADRVPNRFSKCVTKGISQ